MRLLLLSLALLLNAATAAGAQPAYFPSMAAGDVTLPVTSIKQARLAGTLLQKYDFSCGSAALATLLTHHYGTPVDEQTVFAQMYALGDQAKIQREGFSLLDMKRFLASLGFEADGFQQPLDKLQEARIPAIVLVNENGYQHFVVVKGLQGDRVLVGDPAQGTRALSRAAFESLWQSKLLFVIHNAMDAARFNLAADWRVAPRAPLGSEMARAGFTGFALQKHGPGDF
ncbi:peptidase C39 [Acidovorax sp. SRB_14]|uniref:C39 family peptidase n=1 Tax=unclassified Acidovorax TaxID=2684926 RepID=UPI00145D58BA|nr:MULTISPECIES: C39 family peptidase [unclassified Acidovorax]NMM78626.1 peptidase C39 [Acidovorax sp. SRB_24]NMM82758.1 peptidase C39 [Acidovorax sp. SRB_14]NMM92650.1 peptidase C39 [Rhodococcus sp. SRB_17]